MIEKQMRVQKRKAELRDYFKRLEQEETTKFEVLKSKIAGEQRRRKLIARDELIKTLHDEAVGHIATVRTRSPAQYATLLGELILQAAERLTSRETEPRTLRVRVLRADRATVTEAFLRAIARKYESRNRRPVNLVVATEEPLSEETHAAGGVILTTEDSRIICDNSLQARLELAMGDLLHVVREAIFPASEERDVAAELMVEPARSAATAADAFGDFDGDAFGGGAGGAAAAAGGAGSARRAAAKPAAADDPFAM